MPVHDARPRRPPAAARLALAACRRPARFVGTDAEVCGADLDDTKRPWLSLRAAATVAPPLADPVRTRAPARRLLAFIAILVHLLRKDGRGVVGGGGDLHYSCATPVPCARSEAQAVERLNERVALVSSGIIRSP